MRAVAVVSVLASVSAADSLDYLESGSLSLLQTAVVKSHNHGSAKWLPGSGYVVNKCGEGGNLADIRPDLAGWTGGDAHAVGTQKIDNAPTPDGCIENVLKDPRCQLEDRKAEIDARNNQPEYVARNKPFAYNIAAGYAPGQGKCFCSWGTVESQKDGTGNPMQSGWITCIAQGGRKGPKPKDPVPANPNQPTYPPKKKPKFGPDGTWATPYCKSLLGCTPYCVDGCDGVAYWEASRAPPGLGAEGREEYNANNPGAHFLTCIQGDKTRGRPPTPDYNVKTMGGNVQCSGSENSTKESFWNKGKNSIWSTAEKDKLKIAWGNGKSWNSGGAWGDGEGWGNEYCPAGCVNDCAEFKLGGFLSCGYEPHGGESGWTGYNGQRNNAGGPNVLCPMNVVRGTGHQAWMWCGEKKEKVETPEDFVCDLCADSDNDFDPDGKRGKCKKINDKAQKSVKACEKRKGRSGVQKRCCPDPPVECPLCPDGKEFMPDNLDGKCAKIASKATKNQEKCDNMKARKRPQRHCCVAPPVECPLCPDGQEFKPGNLNGKCEKLATKATKTEATCDKFKGQKRVGKCCEATKTYTPDDFALTKANECPAGTKTPDYKTCHDQASNYKWPGQPAGHTQRWDEEDHDPEFGAGWTFMPPGCVLYTGWPSGSHAAQVRWNPNQNGKNDGNRAKVCEKDDGTDGITPTKEKNDVVCTPESCPKTDDDKVKCGKGWTQGEGSGLALTRVVIGWPSAPLPNAAACVKAIKADPRCDDMDTVTYVDPEYTKAGKRDSTRLIGYCSCNGKVQLISPMEQYIACSLRRPWSEE